MNYTVTIEFEGERHCLRCPMRNVDDDSCAMQNTTHLFQTAQGEEAQQLPMCFGSWDEQMQNCPLKEVE